MITFWPPITIVPPDQTSAGLLRLTRSTSPVMKTWVGVAKKAARAAVARTGRVTSAQSAATAGLRILRTLALMLSTTTPLFGRAPERAFEIDGLAGAVLRSPPLGIAFQTVWGGGRSGCLRHRYGPRVR